MLTPRAHRKPTLFAALLACACLLLAGARTALRAQEIGQQPTSELSGAAARGVELFRRGETDAAVRALRDATKKDKRDADAWYYLGVALVKQGKTKDARKPFENAARLRPTFAVALNGLAYTLLAQGKIKEARGVVEGSLKLDPKRAETRYLQGVVHLRSNSFAKALGEAEASAQLDPSYAPAHYLKGEALVALSDAELGDAADEKEEARTRLLKSVLARLDEADAALDKFALLKPQSRDATKVAE